MRGCIPRGRFFALRFKSRLGTRPGESSAARKLNPKTETAVSHPMGSTGDSPVPGGDPPPGREKARTLFRAVVSRANVSPVPSGQWPDGTGGSPVPPIPLRISGSNQVGDIQPWLHYAPVKRVCRSGNNSGCSGVRVGSRREVNWGDCDSPPPVGGHRDALTRIGLRCIRRSSGVWG
jgi:hypothetical protein